MPAAETVLAAGEHRGPRRRFRHTRHRFEGLRVGRIRQTGVQARPELTGLGEYVRRLAGFAARPRDQSGDDMVPSEAEMAGPHRQRGVVAQPLRTGQLRAAPARVRVAELQRRVAAGVPRQPVVSDPYRVQGSRRPVQGRIAAQDALVKGRQVGPGSTPSRVESAWRVAR